MALYHETNDEQMNHPRNHSRLVIDIVPELLRSVSSIAAQHNLSVQEYVRRVLEQSVSSEAHSQQKRQRLNRAALDELLQYREEIRRAHPGQVFEDSTELLRQAREERTKELEQR